MQPVSLPRAIRPCRGCPSVLLARLLALDDLRAGDLVVQRLALVVPERPQTVEQEDDEVDAADERHELDRGEQAPTDGRDDVEGARASARRTLMPRTILPGVWAVVVQKAMQ